MSITTLDVLKMMNEVQALGLHIAGSRLISGITPDQGAVIAFDLCLKNMSFGDWNAVHQLTMGKIALKADAMLARFKDMGGECVWITKADDANKQEAEWTFKENKKVKVGFTMKQAEDAGYTAKNANWKKVPSAMLRARAASIAIRMLAPQVNGGMHTPEEIEDSTDEQPPAAEPQAIAPVDAAEKIKAVQAEQLQPQQQPVQQTQQPVEIPVQAQPVETPFAEPPDVSLCPLPGNMCGIAWVSFVDADLAQVQNVNHQAMTPGHYAAIKTEIEKRATK